MYTRTVKAGRRTLFRVGIAIIALTVLVVVFVHLPAVQRSVWNRLASSIEESTGWQVTAEGFALRALPARLRMSGVSASYGGRTAIRLQHLEARWSWFSALTTPHRLKRVTVDHVRVDPDAFPRRSGPADASGPPLWELFEIGELRVRGLGGGGSISDIEVVVEGLNIDGKLVSGVGTARISVRRVSLDRDGRVLDFGKIDVEGRAADDVLRIERFESDSGSADLSITGAVDFAPETSGSFIIKSEVDIRAIAHWWDPNLVTGLEPEGVLALEGRAEVTEPEGLSLELRHHGEDFRVAGYDIEECEVEIAHERPTVRLAHPSWGRASATVTAPGVAEMSATLDEAPIDRVVAFLAPRTSDFIGRPATLSGAIEGTLSLPVSPEHLAAQVDLVMRSPRGQVDLRAAGAGLGWRVEELEARGLGMTLHASGTLGQGGALSADATLTASDPNRAAASLQKLIPETRGFEVGGGPANVRARFGGTLSSPSFAATFDWTDPIIAGRRLEGIVGGAAGGLELIHWTAELSITGGTSLEAAGEARPLGATVGGGWELRADNLGELMAALAVPSEMPVKGRVDGKGRFDVDGENLRVEGEVSSPGLEFGEWLIEDSHAAFLFTPEAVVVTGFELEAYGGAAEGKVTLPMTDVSAPVSGELRWQGVDLGALPLELPGAAAGLISGHLRVDGSMDLPTGDLELWWLPDDPGLFGNEVRLLGDLANGRACAVSEGIETEWGSASVEVTAPLGDLPLPVWLWPDAAGGPVRVEAEVRGFRSGPLLEHLEIESMPVGVEADIQAVLDLNLMDPENSRVRLETRDLRVRLPAGELAAEGPMIVSFDENRLEVEPVFLVGMGTRIEAWAKYDPATRVVNGRLRSRLTPEVSGILPVPLNFEGPIELDADFELPADQKTSLTAVHGVVTVDHSGGRMVMRDPPVEIRDLRFVAAVDEGVIDIIDGSAEVNRGHVDLGGGWDPMSGQGLVLELDRVTAMVAGILSVWDGDLVIEPQADRLAQVSGDLSLVAGVWDERFDLASAILGENPTTSTDDVLHDIGLDLTVRGRAGIRVENNLGRFDVNWDQLRVEGTAASPVLRGEVRIAPGGVLNLAGNQVALRRGVVAFTGNPEIDPLIEIVPEEGTTLFGDEGGTEATELATRGLAQGITSALGFENETLRPAEIAVQTESDPSQRFMVGQRLSRRLALFLAANLTDVQDRMTMLQYWNIPRFKGLALQGYQETVDDSYGANIFQRFEWGGSTTLSERPEIYRVRLDGEWPLSKRSLRRATRLRRGQPYDGFLLFVGAVRMERMLSEHGWQDARVTGKEQGKGKSPTLVYTCQPGPRQPIRFEGDSIPTNIRREVTAMYRRSPLEAASFEDMTSEVRRFVAAEGFLEPDITIERRGDEVVVAVRKGAKTELRGPFFEGLPADAESRALRVFSSEGSLALAIDRPEWARGVVHRILKSAGYLDAEVLDVRMEISEPGQADVWVSVAPGRRTVVESVEIAGSDPLGLTAESAFALRPGMPLDRPRIDSEARDIRNAYIEKGYRETSVRTAVERDESGSWHLRVSVEPGRRRIVREVRVTGHRDVSEKVLRKGVTLTPGEVLTDDDIDRSASRIANFSPVEKDTVRVIPVGANEADVEFGIVEKRRWTVEAGGGWSTERSFGAAFGARDENLFGRGIGLNLRGSIDSVAKKFFLLGSIPPVPGGRLSFISTVGYSTGDAPYDPDRLNQDQKLASLEASYRLPKNLQLGVYYRWTDTRTYEKVPDEFFPLDISVQIGVVGARILIDRFDYLFDPRRGWGLTSDLGWSGAAIGSELEYASWLSNFSFALEPFRGATWMQALRLGVAEPLKGTSLDPEARFFAGGQASVRGFDLNTVGPSEYGTAGSFVPKGGGALFILNEELRIPIWDPLRAAVFADVGQVWESWRDADLDLSVGVGFGIRWSTPIGPLWADVAWPVANIGISSRKPKFYLGIGRPF
jgi:outer membrane protein assembly factor BamA